MNREKLKALIPIIQAWVDGKEVQYRSRYTNNEWVTAKDTSSLGFFCQSMSEYRIKPEPRTIYRVERSDGYLWAGITAVELAAAEKMLLAAQGSVNTSGATYSIVKYVEKLEA